MNSSLMQKYFCLVATILITSSCAFAFQLDHSVDEEIRRNYNPSKLEQESLPPLPMINSPDSKTVTTKPKTTTTNPPKSVPSVPTANPVVKKVNKNLPNSQLSKDDFTAIKIKSGTKFHVKSNGVVSDYLREGEQVSFTITKPVTQRYVTIPAGAVLTATVKDSHLPQITGNGGLVVLELTSLNFKNGSFSAQGKVTKANNKKIFFNNIKGKREYWKGVAIQVDKGQKFYEKTRKASSSLSNNPFGSIISPIPTIVGTATYAVNFVLSPIISIGHKGSRISIPAGSEFELKLQEDVYLSL